jgi:hypothetical protein
MDQQLMSLAVGDGLWLLGMLPEWMEGDRLLIGARPRRRALSRILTPPILDGLLLSLVLRQAAWNESSETLPSMVSTTEGAVLGSRRHRHRHRHGRGSCSSLSAGAALRSRGAILLDCLAVQEVREAKEHGLRYAARCPQAKFVTIYLQILSVSFVESSQG